MFEQIIDKKRKDNTDVVKQAGELVVPAKAEDDKVAEKKPLNEPKKVDPPANIPPVKKNTVNTPEKENSGEPKKKKSGIWMISIVIILLIMASLIFFFMPNIRSMVLGDNLNFNGKLACPTDTQVCDNGKIVRRIGPKCQFEDCPKPPEREECVKDGELLTTVTLDGEKIIFECCDALLEEQAYTISMNECVAVDDVAVCISCPNDECGPGENKCNCPQDCRELDPSLWPNENLKVWELAFKLPPNYLFKNKEDVSAAVTREYRHVEEECLSDISSCTNPNPDFSISSRIIIAHDLMSYAISNNSYPAENFSTTTIAGYDFIKLETREDLKVDSYYLKNENKVYEFTFYNLPKEDIDILLKSVELLPPFDTEWVVYNNNTLNYSFKHPLEWNISDMKTRVELSDLYGNKTVSVAMTDLTVLGISYCAANLSNSTRCELVKIGDKRGIIDWVSEGKVSADVDIDSETGISIVLEDREGTNEIIFRRILESFEFTDSLEGIENMKDMEIASTSDVIGIVSTSSPDNMDGTNDMENIYISEECNFEIKFSNIDYSMENNSSPINYCDNNRLLLYNNDGEQANFGAILMDNENASSVEDLLLLDDGQLLLDASSTENKIVYVGTYEAIKSIFDGVNFRVAYNILVDNKILYIEFKFREGFYSEDALMILEDMMNELVIYGSDVISDNNETDSDEPINDNNDADNDGLSDADEVIYGTDINNPDTDGDGYSDGEEVAGGYNPNGEGKIN